jgi:hypothetical protein
MLEQGFEQLNEAFGRPQLQAGIHRRHCRKRARIRFTPE